MSSPMDPPALVAECTGYSEAFDANLGIASIFVVMVLSAVGFLLPAFISKHKSPSTQLAIAGASAAGTGVLLCVALVHILADAEESLSSPCLPEAFTSAFPNWACLIAAVTIMLMVIMDYLLQGYYEYKFTTKLLANADQQQEQRCEKAAGNSTEHLEHSMTSRHSTKLSHSRKSSRSSALPGSGCQSFASPFEIRAPSALMNAAFSGALAPDVEAVVKTNDVENQKDAQAVAEKMFEESCEDGGAHGHGHHSLPKEASLALKRGAVVFVEASVCTHSIPVGLSLGLQGGTAFVSLFIAVIIHQVLEGLGVGAAAVEGQFAFKKLLLLAAGFSLTAPIGIALGVGLHYSLNQSDPTYLMALGIVNALASGMLLYVAIEHMNALSNHGGWLRKQAWWKQALVLLSFCAGGVALIVIGKWA